MILIRLRDAFETPSWKTEQTSSQSLHPVHFSGLIARTLPMGSINSLSFHYTRLVKNTHLWRSSHPSSLRRTIKYASLLRISRALHLGIFDQPAKDGLFDKISGNRRNLI